MDSELRYWKLPWQLVSELEEPSYADSSAPNMSRELEEWILRYPHPGVWSGVAYALTASQEFLERLYWLSDDAVTRENVGINPTAPLHIVSSLPLSLVPDLGAFAVRMGRPDLADDLWRRAEASDDTILREVWLALGAQIRVSWFLRVGQIRLSIAPSTKTTISPKCLSQRFKKPVYCWGIGRNSAAALTARPAATTLIAG